MGTCRGRNFASEIKNSCPMKSFAICLLAWCAWLTVQAQEPGRELKRPVEKVLGFNLGYRDRLLLDEQKSALTYASGEYLAGLFYRREGHHSVLKIAISAGRGDFYARHFKERWLYSTTYDLEGVPDRDSLAVASALTGGNVELDYLLKLNPGRRTTWLAGASLREMMVYTDNKIGLFNSLGLHASLGLHHQLGGRSRLLANLSFPLAALNSRLPWHNTASDPADTEIRVFFKKGTRLVGPADFRMPELEMDYEVRITRAWNLGAGYRFTWLHLPAYQPLKSVVHTFQLHTSFKLQ